MDLDTFLLFEHDKDLVLRVSLACEADYIWGLPQIRSDYIEAVVADLQESDLMAGVRN